MIVRFLGTGPAGGRPGRGRSRRTESSLAVVSDVGTILIDVTRDFVTQARALDRVDLVLITHAHRDASGGVARLDRWLGAPASLRASRDTIGALRARHRRFEHLELRGVRSGAPFTWRGWRITPLVVPHARDCTTFAWRLKRGRCSIVYASDVARLTRGLASLAARCDLLVLDGAMWRRRIFTHLEIQAAIPIVARWSARRVLLTQLGRSTPPHEHLDRWLRGFDARFGAAYDGLELRLDDLRHDDAAVGRCISRADLSRSSP
jgi:phosphoribosyl 1,2-cyclic phosphodiesterase